MGGLISVVGMSQGGGNGSFRYSREREKNMRDSEQNILPVRQTHGQAIVRRKSEYLLFQCLIVSHDIERQEMLARGAADNGWETIVCGDAESALDHKRRKFVQLAVVDLQSDYEGDLAELLQQFSSANGMLTIVCGSDCDMEEEIWARQLGVWLYLPGVNDGTNVAMLCGEAKHIVERMHAAASVPAQRKSMRRAR